MLGFSAVNTGNNLLFLVVSGLLAFMAVTGLAGMYNIKKLVPSVLPPEEIFAEIPAVFHITIHNTKRYLPSFLIRVENSAARPHDFPVLLQDSGFSAPVVFTFNRRGSASVGRITISSPYPVGFFTRYWSFETDQTITVFPKPVSAAISGGGEETAASGLHVRRDHGNTGELERIFPYTGSEPLRMIHWKHSARRNDELLVKGFGRSVAVPLIIDLDGLRGAGIEERLSRAAWLVQRWVQVRPVGLLLEGRTIPARMGRRHGLLLQEELALYGGN